MAPVTRRDLVEELAKTEQELVSLSEELGASPAQMNPQAKERIQATIAAAGHARDSLARQLATMDQVTLNQQQARFNFMQVLINALLFIATAVGAGFTVLNYLRCPR